MGVYNNRPFDSLLVMAYIIQRCMHLHTPYINTTKLQKLMFCCYGVCLAKYGFRLSDESPEAWQYGPVFPSTLSELQKYTYKSVGRISTKEIDEKMPKEIKSLIDLTLMTFGKFAANQLSNWSHLPGSPWSITSKNGKILREQIKDNLITDYFANYVLRSEARAN